MLVRLRARHGLRGTVARVKVWVEPPPGWGPTRAMLGQLVALGYTVQEVRVFDTVGRSILVITG